MLLCGEVIEQWSWERIDVIWTAMGQCTSADQEASSHYLLSSSPFCPFACAIRGAFCLKSFGFLHLFSETSSCIDIHTRETPIISPINLFHMFDSLLRINFKFPFKFHAPLAAECSSASESLWAEKRVDVGACKMKSAVFKRDENKRGKKGAPVDPKKHTQPMHSARHMKNGSKEPSGSPRSRWRRQNI